jgi:hypothetical protein
MAINWKTPAQALINKIGVSDATNPPPTGFTWSGGGAQPDQWACMDILASLLQYGPVYDAQGSPGPFALGDPVNGPYNLGDIIVRLVNQVNIALTAAGGGTFSGTKPASLRIGWPWI